MLDTRERVHGSSIASILCILILYVAFNQRKSTFLMVVLIVIQLRAYHFANIGSNYSDELIMENSLRGSVHPRVK
jgi:hypothetical protein